MVIMIGSSHRVLSPLIRRRAQEPRRRRRPSQPTVSHALSRNMKPFLRSEWIVGDPEVITSLRSRAAQRRCNKCGFFGCGGRQRADVDVTPHRPSVLNENGTSSGHDCTLGRLYPLKGSFPARTSAAFCFCPFRTSCLLQSNDLSVAIVETIFRALSVHKFPFLEVHPFQLTGSG